MLPATTSDFSCKCVYTKSPIFVSGFSYVIFAALIRKAFACVGAWKIAL